MALSRKASASSRSSWTSRSLSLTPSPSCTTSGCWPFMRMPLSRFLPKTSGLPCSRTQRAVGLGRPSRSASPKAPSLKMLQFWRISTNDAPRCSWRARERSPAGAWPRRRRCARRSVASAPSATRDRVERVVDRADRRRLGDLADLRGRRVLALGQAVDAVVEEQDVDVDVAAQHVDQVVAADARAVAVAGDHPHRRARAASTLRPVAIAGARPWMVWKP